MSEEAAQATPEAAGELPAESLLTGQEPTDTGQEVALAEADAKGDSPEGEEQEVQGAPEQYEPFTMPEGMDLDQEILDEFQALAKEHDLPQAEAQKYADFGAKLVQKAQESTVSTLQETWAETCKQWVEEIKTDKELGGDNLQQSLAVARKAISTFGDESLMQVLEETGMTNNPALVRFAHRIGKALLDDTLHVGAATSAASRTPEQILYPTMQ
jgi:hypothetical protein